MGHYLVCGMLGSAVAEVCSWEGPLREGPARFGFVAEDAFDLRPCIAVTVAYLAMRRVGRAERRLNLVRLLEASMRSMG